MKLISFDEHLEGYDDNRVRSFITILKMYQIVDNALTRNGLEICIRSPFSITGEYVDHASFRECVGGLVSIISFIWRRSPCMSSNWTFRIRTAKIPIGPVEYKPYLES